MWRTTLNEEAPKFKIFIGWDSREDIAYQVARQSILKHTSIPVEIIPLKQKQLRKDGLYNRPIDTLSSTEFTFTRFLIPELMQYKGWALFIDCDFVFLNDIKDLIDQIDDQYAIMCAQHDYNPTEETKMDGKKQTQYPRKNWSSMMLINCEHPSNRCVTKEFVNDLTKTGAYLHRFSWLDDSEIGAISYEWNWLVGWYKQPKDGIPKALHYTEGGPWFKEYQDCEYNHEWYNLRIEFLENTIAQKDSTIENISNRSINVDALHLSDQKKT